MATAETPLCVLVIEDHELQRELIAAYVRQAGFRVICAETGRAAITAFVEQQPDVVLLDYELPDMLGKEVVVQLRELQRDWLPILFLSAHHELDVQRECLRFGGDDYLTKPIDFPTLELKIRAMVRLASMQRRIREQAQQLHAHIQQEERENAAAHYLYERLTASDAQQLPDCQQLIVPAQQFSGDIICTSIGTNGHWYLLLADATGHGLSAAIGLIPVTQVFHSMTRKGHHISTIAREMNRQIRQFTPSYRFVACALIEIDPGQHQIDAWNGGMPTGQLYQRSTGNLRAFASRHVALGLANDVEFHADIDRARYQPGDRLLLYSDGLSDAENPSGERFGNLRPATLLTQLGPDFQLTMLQAELEQHLQGSHAHDDVAMILLPLPAASTPGGDSALAATSTSLSPCELTFVLHDQLIAGFDLLPSSIDWLRRVGVPDTRIARLHTVLMELVTNAVDHGLLGLDSELKEGPDGFMCYLEERMLRLQQLRQARLQVSIALRREEQPAETRNLETRDPETQNPETQNPDEPTRTASTRAAATMVAVIRVSDSGPGFDVTAAQASSPRLDGKSGRGLQLVRLLARNLRFFGNGNQVEVELPL